MYDKWSLEVLYSGFDEKFQADFNKIDEYIARYNSLAASLGTKDDRTTVKEIITLMEDFQQIFRLYSYCSLRQSVNTNDAESVSYIGRLMQKYNEVTKSATILEQYLGKVENLDEVIGDDELLNEYS